MTATIVVFYSLSNAFDLIYGSKFREDISKYFEIKIGHPRLSVGESILLIHACAYRIVIYGVAW